MTNEQVSHSVSHIGEDALCPTCRGAGRTVQGTLPDGRNRWWLCPTCGGDGRQSGRNATPQPGEVGVGYGDTGLAEDPS